MGVLDVLKLDDDVDTTWESVTPSQVTMDGTEARVRTVTLSHYVVAQRPITVRQLHDDTDPGYVPLDVHVVLGGFVVTAVQTNSRVWVQKPGGGPDASLRLEVYQGSISTAGIVVGDVVDAGGETGFAASDFIRVRHIGVTGTGTPVIADVAIRPDLYLSGNPYDYSVPWHAALVRLTNAQTTPPTQGGVFDTSDGSGGFLVTVDALMFDGGVPTDGSTLSYLVGVMTPGAIRHTLNPRFASGIGTISPP